MTSETLPRIGVGTWGHSDPDVCKESVVAALDVGYRHVDTAQAYYNEASVGDAIQAAPVPREEIFLATKVPPEDLSHRDVLDTTRSSLDRLGVDTIDLLYVHWPRGEYDPEETLGAFDELVADGLVRNVGVSNFTPALLDEARDVLDSALFAHQAELHPLLQQRHLVEYAQRHDLYLAAYSPLARGEVFEITPLEEIAAKHDVGVAQVCLAWLFGKDNVCAVPKATGAHVRANYRALDLTLDPEDVAKIESIDSRHRVVDKPDAPWNS